MSPAATFADGTGSARLAAYDSQRAQGRTDAARRALMDALAQAPEADWLACARALVLRGDANTARALLVAARANWPDSVELRHALAGLLMEAGEPDPAEALLRELLALQPSHTAASFLLARLLSRQGRMHAAARTVRALFEHGTQDTDTLIQAVELLDDCDRKQDAAALCEAALAVGCSDPRIHAYAGMLEIQLGAFDQARAHYTYALAHDTRALEWNIPIGLSSMQRYRDASHPDFRLFRDALQRAGLSDKARCTTLFALGKAHDDVGDYATATDCLRQANAIAHVATAWSRKQWRRGVDARLTSQPRTIQLQPPDDWTPVFIVGVPRSGTTLVAELLARHPDVCNRGELAWLGRLAQPLSLLDESRGEAFAQAAAHYAAQLRQDDSGARWFIDKQPLNLLHVDLILALWPNARIIHCQRNPRDVALSLWSQSFLDDAHGYAYDFADIAVVIRDCERLMAHWRKRHGASIRTVRYEQLAFDTGHIVADLATWLQLPDYGTQATVSPASAISTASLWQARQPVYTCSVERWRHYAPYLSELLRIPGN